MERTLRRWQRRRVWAHWTKLVVAVATLLGSGVVLGIGVAHALRWMFS